MNGRPATVLLLVLGLAGAPAATSATATPARASLTDLESQVMCVTCGVPLSIASSPQADHERAYIRELIKRGSTGAQIKQALVAQLGPGVLALPEGHGFALAVYLVPVALIATLAGLLAVALPRWRARGEDSAAPPDTVEPQPGEEVRLDEELARYRG